MFLKVTLARSFFAGSCGADGDWANALIEQQSAKNTAGVQIFRDCRKKLRLSIFTSGVLTGYFSFHHQADCWNGKGSDRRVIGLSLFQVASASRR